MKNEMRPQATLLAAFCLVSTQVGEAALVIAFSESDEGKVRVQMRGQIDNFQGSELVSATPTPGFTTTYSGAMASNLFFAGYNSAPNHTYSVISLSSNNWQPLVADFFLSGAYNIATVPFFGFTRNSLYIDSNYVLGTYLDIDVIADANWNNTVSRPTPSQGDSATLNWDGGNQSMTFQIGALAPVPEPTTSVLLAGTAALALAVTRRRAHKSQ